MADRTVNRTNNIVTIGRTAPIKRGPATKEESLPVVLATDQTAIPVVEQNKIQSEVALSLLGIPRSEVALGIFADVNTYDVDPSEWTNTPIEKRILNASTNAYEYQNLPTSVDVAHGLSHVPEEAGALLEAPPNKSAVLTSKRFFRYQPGRVSAATFGVKTSVVAGSPDLSVRNPAIRKYGIYDNFDGYYWETRDTGIGDQFCVVRRTQALIKHRTGFELAAGVSGEQSEDYGIAGTVDTTVSDFTASNLGATTITMAHSAASVKPKIGMTVTDVTPDTTNTHKFRSSNIKPNSIITVVDDDGTNYTITLSQTLNSTSLTTKGTYKAHFVGDLVIARDGLTMSHAAIYDPTLLKDETTYNITAKSTQDITLDSVTDLEIGQIVRYDTDGSSTNKILNGENSLLQIASINITTKVVTFRTLTGGTTPFLNDNTLTNNHFIKTPVPFIFPAHTAHADADIMFPYSREFDVNLNNYSGTTRKGVIDTRIITDDGSDRKSDFKTEVDAVNNGTKCKTLDASGDTNEQGWANWIRHNVKSEYYGVYEYRIPRSRFSFDFLDGSGPRNFQFSDVVRTSAAGTDTIKYPGVAVKNADDTAKQLLQSQWNIDFTKVIMNKIEFSWYGAVGALFLAYVPVSNDEARWVRVHHIRASNQLKVASLGNATLPITYTVFGGGTQRTEGRGLTTKSTYAGGKSASEFVIKYGSSYYIDGGDRGTVRLFNFSSDSSEDVKSSSYTTGTAKTAQQFNIVSVFNEGGRGKITIESKHGTADNSPHVAGYDEVADDIVLFAKVKTGNNNDNDLKVVYAERDFSQLDDCPHIKTTLILNKEFFNASSVSTGNVEFLTTSGQVLYGLTSKTEIESSQGFKVRNRVQVYPTKLSVGLTGQSSNATRLELIKNAIYQNDIVHTLEDESPMPERALTINGASVSLATSGLPTRLILGGSNANLTSAFADSSIAIGDEKLYGWFRAKDAQNNERTLFGHITRVTPTQGGTREYDFVSLDTFNVALTFTNNVTFLYAKQYNADGSLATAVENVTNTEIERLSSVVINKTTRRPIPNTGTRIASFFLRDGSEYFDLSPYFDYNKDYISFPLTDIPDNLYLVVKADRAESAGTIAASVTWEEQ